VSAERKDRLQYRRSFISIEQVGYDKEPITLSLDGGGIVVQGYGKRSLGTVCGKDGLKFSYEDVLRAEELLAKSLPA
jgi:hypothetical protein